MTRTASSTQQNIYLQRINTVIDYIRQHPTQDLALDTLADVACFSPFHFHRIFKSIVGETLNQFVARLRMERAVLLLKSAPEANISDVIHECGFSSLAVFSRTFKKRYGISPREWDRETALNHSKIDQVFEGFPDYTIAMFEEIEDSGEFSVQIREMPAQHMAYIRVSDSYTPGKVIVAYERLVEWFLAQGGDLRNTKLFGMSQDDPDITPLALCQYDFCLTVPENWQGEGEISTRVFPACTLAFIHVIGDIYVVDRAWRYLFRYWLPRSRYQPDNLPAMEIYRRQPIELGWEIYDLDAAVPILPLV